MPLDKKNTISTAPSADGVYMMLDASGTILYVGKAKNIKQRIRSYFASRASHKTKKLIAESAQLKTIITNNETEALLLEDQLIKQHAPRFNVLLRDDKSYPYLWFSHSEFTQITFRHRKTNKKGTYFGPYISSHALRTTIDLLERTFQLRTCSDAVFKHRKQPCLKYQIHCCSAPCVGLIDASTYKENIKQAQRFLRNVDYSIIDTLTSHMHTAAQEENFEKAALLRDTIIKLRSIQQERNQAIVTHTVDVDVWGIYALGEVAFAQLLQVRSGVVRATFSFRSTHTTQTTQATLAALLQQYYLSLPAQELVATIVVPKHMVEYDCLATHLAVRADNKHLSIISNSKNNSIFSRWLMIAHNNAMFAAEQASQKNQQFAHHFSTLAQALGIKQVRTIECFDISHMAGNHTVCAMTVCTTSGLQKSCYKNFIIKHAAQSDDYAATEEAISRRMGYVATSTSKKPSKDIYLPQLPDVLVIDGGVGHIRAALKVLVKENISTLTLLGIAKGPSRKAHNERYYLCKWRGGEVATTSIDELQLNPVPFAVQLVRDQAHNRAVAAMHKRLHKSMNSSISRLKGIGSKRQQQLLIYFKSQQRLIQASEKDIAKVPGIGKKLAKKIQNQLHEAKA